MTQQSRDLIKTKASIQSNLISSGNYELINKHLKLKLYESGWFDEIAQLASNELVENQKRNKQMTFEELFAVLKPKGEQMVPESVREEVLEKIQDYLEDVIV